MTWPEILEKGSLSNVQTWLASDPLAIRGVDPEGTPWSFRIARRGDLNLLRWMVEYSRADMNDRDRQGRTLLFPAVESGNLACCRYLVEQVGIRPLIADRRNGTALELAQTLGLTKITLYLQQVMGLSLDETYKNPVRRGFSPDPSVVRVGEDYYMVNSSFVSFPAIPVSHSRDLIHWTTIGHVIEDSNFQELLGLDSGRGIWAPDISYHEGVFYCIATLRYNDDHKPIRRQLLVSATHPEGPWSEPRFLEEDGIDPSLFRDEGRTFVLLNRGARMFEVDNGVTRKIGETVLLYYGDTKRATEAPHLLKYQGYYYLFLAEGGTGPGHHVNVARSKRREGPYEPCPYNPILAQKDAYSSLQRAGHGKPVETADGRWFLFYLASRQYEEGYSLFGRETCLDSIHWTEDGWPLVNQLQGPSALAAKPLPEIPVNKEQGFGQKKLLPDWYFIRNPLPQSYRVFEGKLAITPSQEWPDSRSCRQILLTRQEEDLIRVSVLLDPASLTEGTSAGLLLYYDETSWLYYGLRRRGQDLLPEFRSCLGSQTQQEIGDKPVAEFSPELSCAISWPNYRFAIQVQGELVYQQEVRTAVLADEGVLQGKRFTGPGIGVFASTGTEKVSVEPRGAGATAAEQRELRPDHVVFSDFRISQKTEW